MSRSDHVKALSAQLEIDHHPLDTLLQFLGYDPEAMLNIGMSPQELLLMLSSEVVAKAESAEVAATLTGEQQAAILALASKAFHGRIANSVNANEDHPLVKQLNELAARNDVETREQFEFLKVLRNSKAFTEGVLTSLGKIATSFIRNETHPAFGRVISFIIKRFSGGALVPGLLKEYSELFWVCLKAGCEHDVVISKVQSFLADRKDDLGGDAHPMYAELYNFVQAYSLFLENIPTVQAPVVSVSDQQKDEGLDEKAGNLVAAIIMEVPVGPNDFALMPEPVDLAVVAGFIDLPEDYLKVLLTASNSTPADLQQILETEEFAVQRIYHFLVDRMDPSKLDAKEKEAYNALAEKLDIFTSLSAEFYMEDPVENGIKTTAELIKQIPSLKDDRERFTFLVALRNLKEVSADEKVAFIRALMSNTLPRSFMFLANEVFNVVANAASSTHCFISRPILDELAKFVETCKRNINNNNEDEKACYEAVVAIHRKCQAPTAAPVTSQTLFKRDSVDQSKEVEATQEVKRRKTEDVPLLAMFEPHDEKEKDKDKDKGNESDHGSDDQSPSTVVPQC